MQNPEIISLVEMILLRHTQYKNFLRRTVVNFIECLVYIEEESWSVDLTLKELIKVGGHLKPSTISINEFLDG